MPAAESPQCTLLPTYADDKVDLKVEPVPPSYQVASEAPPSPADPEPDQSRCCRHRRRWRRVGHIFGALLVLWFTARFVVRHCQLRRFAHPHADGFLWGHHPGHGGHWPRPGDHIDACVDPTEWIEIEPTDELYPRGFEALQRAELSLPTSTDDIFLYSPGSHIGGFLHVIETPDRDDIGVEVIVGSGKDSDLFKKANLCALSRGENGHGVGIFIPPFKHHPRDQDTLFFNITVSLPEGKDVTTIPVFETRLPKYTHFISTLEKHAFGTISLHSFDSPIFVGGLVGDKIDLHSRNGPIWGTFNTSSALEVKTSNSPIGVTVNAFNPDSRTPTKVNLHTSNSYLSANLALLSTPESQSSSSFVVSAHTSNSPLFVNFTEHALDAQLKLQARTSNSPAYVFLQPAFEGTFKLRTSIFPAHVSPDEDVEDPAGLGRKRVVNVKTLGHGSGVVYGDTAWVPQDEEAPAGKVEVSTSSSPLELWL